MIERDYLQGFIKRINEHRMFIQVFYGPRQVGKTPI
jgi:predicted AAA+ superfamily ATPase